MASLIEKNQKNCGNMFMWITLIIIALGVIGFIVFPSAMKWAELNNKIRLKLIFYYFIFI